VCACVCVCVCLCVCMCMRAPIQSVRHRKTMHDTACLRMTKCFALNMQMRDTFQHGMRVFIKGQSAVVKRYPKEKKHDERFLAWVPIVYDSKKRMDWAKMLDLRVLKYQGAVCGCTPFALVLAYIIYMWSLYIPIVASSAAQLYHTSSSSS